MRIRPPWAFALIYTALSMGTEILLIVVFRLRVPQDNRIIAPIILTLPPLLAAGIAGHRTLGGLLRLAALAALCTLVVTITVTRLTGVATGLLEPLINRPVAGFLAAWAADRLARRAARSRSGGTDLSS